MADKFDWWLFELKQYAIKIFGDDVDDWLSFDKEYWIDYYETCHSPKDALEEDMSYWDADD